MTGPEHYAEAERVLREVTQPSALPLSYRVLQPGNHADAIALAQVHATLAIAAAEAMSHIGMNASEEKAWFKAAGIALDISGQQR